MGPNQTFILLLCIKIVLLYPTNDLRTRNTSLIKMDEPERRIVGGSVSRDNYPFLVSIMSGIKPICGGTLINMEWVLTAAHCLCVVRNNKIIKQNTRSYKIVQGVNDLNLIKDMGKINYCKNIYVHPKYRPGLNDIGLIKLVRKYENVTGVNLPETEMVEQALRSTKGTICTVMGWGDHTPRINHAESVLHSVQLTLITLQKCREYYPKWILDTNLCTMNEGKDACTGDSGGPLMCNNFQFGIVSWGEGCAGKQPGVYIRPDKYNSWIRSVLNSSTILLQNSLPFLLIHALLLALFI